ncbi:MAG TPA: heme o synthase [Gemmatimonadales bacterium]|nr:heme o synthase [Gemmatimonadales bacterium]
MSAPSGGAAAEAGAAPERRRLAAFLTLTKPEITFNVVLTALVGFLAAARGGTDVLALVRTLLGTALVAAGASTLNQWAERDRDALMKRTIRRPLPAHRLTPGESLAFGVALAVAGTAYLAWLVSPLAAGLAALTAASYLLVYTPLKRLTSLATVVGAVPGAIPPMIGWAAARGRLDAGAWVLFLILFFWQMPHFLALAALYRKDYARAGFRVLPVEDPDGASTGRQSVLYALALLVVSLLPTPLGMAGPVYFFGALALGAGFLFYGVRLAASPADHARASGLFRYSLLYLPALCTLMALA